jgi:hypothetical protein
MDSVPVEALTHVLTNEIVSACPKKKQMHAVLHRYHYPIFLFYVPPVLGL